MSTIFVSGLDGRDCRLSSSSLVGLAHSFQRNTFTIAIGWWWASQFNPMKTRGLKYDRLRDGAEAGNLSIVRSLLDEGLNVNEGDEDGWTPLLLACAEGHKSIAKFLLQNGAMIDKTLNDGQTCVFLAAENNSLDLLEFLVRKGADKDKAMNGGITPLYIAAQNNHLSIVQYLLSFSGFVDISKHSDMDGWMDSSSCFVS